MENPQQLNSNKETIIWLDQNIYNKENKFIYERYFPKLKEFNFFRFTSVEDLIKSSGR